MTQNVIYLGKCPMGTWSERVFCCCVIRVLRCQSDPVDWGVVQFCILRACPSVSWAWMKRPAPCLALLNPWKGEQGAFNWYLAKVGQALWEVSVLLGHRFPDPLTRELFGSSFSLSAFVGSSRLQASQYTHCLEHMKGKRKPRSSGNWPSSFNLQNLPCLFVLLCPGLFSCTREGWGYCILAGIRNLQRGLF